MLEYLSKQVFFMSEHIVPTKKQNTIQAVKFLFFSISAGIIQTLSFTFFKEVLGFWYWLGYLIALIFSVVYNFTVNRKFTFKSAANVPKAMSLLFAYYLVFTPLSTWWGEALTNIGWNEYIVLFGTMVINLITEFLFCRIVIYRRSMYTNELGKKELEKIKAEGMLEQGETRN